jgi:hypothetical protein
MSIFKRGLIVVALAIILLPSSSVFAAAIDMKYSELPDSNLGNETTAIQKMYYKALSDCAADFDSYDVGTRWSGIMDHHDIIYHDQVTTEKHIFIDGAWDNPWSGGYISWGGGAYIEEKVTGKYKDGKIYCGENSNQLIEQAAAAFGVDYLDIICNAYDGYASSGILYVDPEKSTCKDNPGHYYISTGRSEYLEKLVKDKTFKNNPPGGSLGTFTEVEIYWADKLAFLSACAVGGPQFDNTTLIYQIMEYNETAEAYSNAGYSQKNGADHKVYTFNGNSISCQSLADGISLGSSHAKAYLLSLAKIAVDDCISRFGVQDERMKKILIERGKIHNAAWRVINAVSDAYDNSVNEQKPGGVQHYKPEIVENTKTDIVTKFEEFDAIDIASVDIEAEFRSDIESTYNNYYTYVNGLETGILKFLDAYVFVPGKTVISSRPSQSLVDSLGEDIAVAKEAASKIQTDEIDPLQKAVDDFSKPDLYNKEKSDGIWSIDSDYVVTCPGAGYYAPAASDLPGLNGTNDDEEGPTCYDSDLEGIAWIACPVVDTMAKGTDGIYGWIKGLLVVDARLVASGDNSPTYLVWTYFRDVANVLFVIVLSVIVLSQVTGFGISNYGIKKMLPKLIATAILVNLSYIICQLAVDVSNILGSQLHLLLDSIANTVANKVGLNWVEVAAAGVFDVVLAVVAIAAGSAPAISSVIGGIAAGTSGVGLMVLFLPLIICLLMALISVLVFFLMLGARQIIVVALVAISPVAFICYALPNTESLYKKWWNMFKAALLLFPICGALYGLSQIIKVLVFSASGVHLLMVMLAVIAPFLPYIMLPSLLKKSLAAVGDIGTKIAGVGAKLRSTGAKSNDALKRSELFQDAQRTSRIGLSKRRIDRLRAEQRRGKSLSASQERSLVRHQAFLNKSKAEDNDASIALSDSGQAAVEAKMDSEMKRKMLDNEMTLMAGDTHNYDTDTMSGQLSELLQKDNLSASEQFRAKALMSKMSAQGGYGAKKLSDALRSDNVSSSALSLVSGHFQKDADFAKAMNAKDSYVAQYLREANISSDTGSFTNWSSNPSKMRLVANDLLDDDHDLLAQSSRSVTDSLDTLGTTDEGRARLLRILSDERLLSSSNSANVEMLKTKAAQLGIGVQSNPDASDSSGDTPSIVIPHRIITADEAAAYGQRLRQEDESGRRQSPPNGV